MINQKSEICEQTLLVLAMKKFETIFLFTLVYGGVLYLSSLFFEGKKFIVLAILLLSLMGIIYNGLKLYFSNNFEKFVNEIPIKIIKTCIGRARSIDYGHYVYYPVIEYEYMLNGKKIRSDNVYWDFDSFFYNRGVIGGLIEEESVSHAQKILTGLLDRKKAYQINFYLKSVYLDISLSANRKKYFYNQIILSAILLIVSCYLLLKM